MIVFENMIADMFSNKKRNPIVTELFIRGRKLSIKLVFVKKFYFAVPKNITLNSRHYFILKIPNKQKLQQITFNHSSNTDFGDVTNLYKTFTAKAYFFSVIDTALVSNYPLSYTRIF